MDRRMRFKNPSGEIFYWAISDKQSQLDLGAKPYPYRIWRWRDWKVYYYPKLKPKRFTDRQFVIFMAFLSAILAILTAWIIK